jgi:hypothetical protein
VKEKTSKRPTATKDNTKTSKRRKKKKRKRKGLLFCCGLF